MVTGLISLAVLIVLSLACLCLILAVLIVAGTCKAEQRQTTMRALTLGLIRTSVILLIAIIVFGIVSSIYQFVMETIPVLWDNAAPYLGVK